MLIDRAAAAGVSADEYLKRLLGLTNGQPENVALSLAEFDAAMEEFGENVQPLSPDFSREDIYFSDIMPHLPYLIIRTFLANRSKDYPAEQRPSALFVNHREWRRTLLHTQVLAEFWTVRTHPPGSSGGYGLSPAKTERKIGSSNVTADSFLRLSQPITNGDD